MAASDTYMNRNVAEEDPYYGFDYGQGSATGTYLGGQSTDNGNYWGNIGGYASTPTTYTPPAAAAPVASEKSWYQDPDLLTGLIGAGTGLAGIYFSQQGQLSSAKQRWKPLG